LDAIVWQKKGYLACKNLLQLSPDVFWEGEFSPPSSNPRKEGHQAGCVLITVWFMRLQATREHYERCVWIVQEQKLCYHRRAVSVKILSAAAP